MSKTQTIEGYHAMMTTLKRLMVGQPLETAAQHDQRLTKRIALAVFSSDALSSVAYASEAILGVLIVAGTVALPVVIPISVVIVILLLIVGRQLSLEQMDHVEPVKRHTAVVLISGIHRGVIPALEFAKSLVQDNVTALYVNLDDEQTAKVQRKWRQWGCGVPSMCWSHPIAV
jgi:hypothetical protein